ncbi:MAG: nucleotide-binding protein [Nitrospira sp.]|nr:nucleotide-binding protein [Nitrospira sp.]
MAAIWDYYCKKNKWIPTGVLYHKLEKEAVLSALNDLGGKVVSEFLDSGKYRYQLSFLGILLSYTTDDAVELLARFLIHLKELYLRDPEFERVKSQDIEVALNLTADQTRLLGRLIYGSPFSGGGNYGESEWQVQPPTEVYDFPAIQDFRGYIHTKAMEGYNSAVPVGERERTLSWHNQNASGPLNWMMEPMRGQQVFIVHGHDDATKKTVTTFIESLGLHAVVLHDQPNSGRTIIEKFEAHSNVGFAVVLLTPDDIGASSKDRENSQPRARQNVILELGFFLGKIGREKVCVLYKEGVEIPSDYQGVLYTPYDSSGSWRSQLVKELKHAGFAVDTTLPQPTHTQSSQA